MSEIRKKEKNVLFLDAGDQFQGTVWFNYYKGAEAAHFMNKLGYDAMVNTLLIVIFLCATTHIVGFFCCFPKRSCCNSRIIELVFD